MNVKYMVAALGLSLASVANAGLYLGGEVNSTAVSAVTFEDTFGDFSDRAAGYGLTAGWKFGQVFGVEAQYLKPESLEDKGLTVDAEGWTVSGLGFIPLGEKWSIFGEVGYYDFSTDLEVDEQPSESLSGDSGVLFGAGVNWEFVNNFNARLGATLYDSEGASVNQVALGLLYEF